MARRAHRRQRGGRRHYGTILAAIVLIALAIGVGGWFAFLAWTSPRTPKLEQATLCPVDGPRSRTIVLVDATDDLPDIGRRQVQGRLMELAQTTPTFGLLELRMMDQGAPGGRIVFSKCNPGDGSDLNELTANPEMARRKWLQEFDTPLQDVLSNGFETMTADESPIMEAIQQIAVEQFDGNARSLLSKKLVIVSDMIENTKVYSQYKGNLTYSRFIKSSAYRQLRTDLGGAEVDILYVQRISPVIDALEHAEFWREWVADNNGRLGSIERLQGAN